MKRFYLASTCLLALCGVSNSVIGADLPLSSPSISGQLSLPTPMNQKRVAVDCRLLPSLAAADRDSFLRTYPECIPTIEWPPVEVEDDSGGNGGAVGGGVPGGNGGGGNGGAVGGGVPGGNGGGAVGGGVPR